jgi:hypothetical protein
VIKLDVSLPSDHFRDAKSINLLKKFGNGFGGKRRKEFYVRRLQREKAKMLLYVGLQSSEERNMVKYRQRRKQISDFKFWSSV